ncbi:hypothetical protein [Spirosoma spitsbergense]|uniref:hypothetical protein n=1 Tax=Spirosoma spitsbergense TaxID=431554 RepID=UPI000378BB8D|nr:hypothetical protein [Spirosoma spitsbergense]
MVIQQRKTCQLGNQTLVQFGKWSILWALTLLSCQSTNLQVLRSPHELTSTLGQSWVKTFRSKPRKHQVLLIDRKNHHWWLPAESVWGYQTDKGARYRLLGDGEYEVMQEGPLIIYRNHPWGISAGNYYYFSLTPNSAIYNLSKRTCRKVFSQDGCMLTLLNQMQTGRLLDTDAYGSYGLVNAYAYCHFRHLTGQ